MTLLAPEADRAVRDAVEAFMAGALRPSMLGETMFETKNSRYRLMDGVLFSSSDTTMIGAELVGWLLEGPSQSVVQDGWIAGARGVLVDRRKSRNIIVTSTSRLFRVDATGSGLKPFPQAPAGSMPNQVGSGGHQAPEAPRGYQPPPAVPLSPTPSAHLGPPTHRKAIPPCPPPPIGRVPGTTELSVATAMITREPSQPGAPLPLPPPTPLPVRSVAPVHPPPRLTGKHPRSSHPSIPGMGAAPGLRPLPFPAPPPSRRPEAYVPRAHAPVHAPVQAMREIEVEEDPTAKHDRASLPLPPPASAPRPAARADAPPASGLRRSGPPGAMARAPVVAPRKASRRGITLS
jgi:hypothetical protein